MNRTVKTHLFTKLLAVAGVILTGIPVVAPLVFAIISFASGNGFRLDYLMPGELFIMVLVGAGLIIWAAIRAKTILRPIIWVLGVSFVFFFGSQVLAQVTGLANGRLPKTGLLFTVVMLMLIIYDLGVVALTVLGGILIKRAFSTGK